MQLNPFPAFPLWANLLLGGSAATLIWYAGTKLERYSAAIAERTGLSKAFLGLLFLATVTSLPGRLLSFSCANPGCYVCRERRFDKQSMKQNYTSLGLSRWLPTDSLKK